MLEKAIALNPQYVHNSYRFLLGLNRIVEDHEDIEKYSQLLSKKRHCNPVTYNNYQRLKDIVVRQRKLKLVCAQYPTRSAQLLKELFTGQDRVIFVDNETIFTNAIKQEGFWAYFKDSFAGDFGHCTPKGNRLLSENIADVIIEECFGQKF